MLVADDNCPISNGHVLIRYDKYPDQDHRRHSGTCTHLVEYYSIMDIHSLFSSERLRPIDDVVKSVNDEFIKVCDSVEAHFVSVGTSINEAIRATTWLPDAIKPPPRAPQSRCIRPPVPLGYFEASQKWVSEHRAVTAAVVAFVGTSVFIVWRRRRRFQRSKRRARRGKNGLKTEVVILAGSPHSSLTRSLALNLERRGFIVYILVSDPSEEDHVRSESKADIRPLYLDITSVRCPLFALPAQTSFTKQLIPGPFQPSSSTTTLQDFASYLSQPHSSQKNDLHLSSLIILPPSVPPAAPISAIHPMTWSDTFTTHLLAPFTTLYSFTHLLAAHKSSLLFLTPSIIPPLTPPTHGPENVAAGALQNYIQTLRREVASQEINIVQLKLGAFDYSTEPGEWALVSTREEENDSSSQADPASDSENSKPSGWDAAFPFRYGNPRRPSTKMHGSPLRELHDGVFDAIKRGKAAGGTMFVGRGSRMYDFVARWVPDGLVGWMLGAGQGSWGVDGDLGKGKGKGKAKGRGMRERGWEKVEKEGAV